MTLPGAGSTGQRLGRYHLAEPLGGGPTGEVFRAKVYGVAGFEREFAVKRFHSDFINDPRIAAAITTAARNYGSLEHPRIARLYEYGVNGGITFTATELVSGIDLARLMGSVGAGASHLPPGTAVALMSQAARAVGFAHGRGIFHLGLCPTNLIVTSDGEVKVTDFGILPPRLPGRPGNDDSLYARMPYLAPEQLVGEPTSAATDVFQLGSIAYELLSGRPAFSGSNALEVSQAVLSGQPAPLDLPKSLNKVLQRCLARSPFERFPDARALADAIDAALRASPLPGTIRDVIAIVEQALQRLNEISNDQVSGAVNFPLPAPPRTDPGIPPTLDDDDESDVRATRPLLGGARRSVPSPNRPDTSNELPETQIVEFGPLSNSPALERADTFDSGQASILDGPNEVIEMLEGPDKAGFSPPGRESGQTLQGIQAPGVPPVKMPPIAHSGGESASEIANEIEEEVPTRIRARDRGFVTVPTGGSKTLPIGPSTPTGGSKTLPIGPSTPTGGSKTLPIGPSTPAGGSKTLPIGTSTPPGRSKDRPSGKLLRRSQDPSDSGEEIPTIVRTAGLPPGQGNGISATTTTPGFVPPDTEKSPSAKPARAEPAPPPQNRAGFPATSTPPPSPPPPPPPAGNLPLANPPQVFPARPPDTANPAGGGPAGHRPGGAPPAIPYPQAQPDALPQLAPPETDAQGYPQADDDPRRRDSIERLTPLPILRPRTGGPWKLLAAIVIFGALGAGGFLAIDHFVLSDRSGADDPAAADGGTAAGTQPDTPASGGGDAAVTVAANDGGASPSNAGGDNDASADDPDPDTETGKGPVPLKSDKLVIRSKPRRARVYLDGSRQGKTKVTLEGTTDRHQLALLLPGYKLYTAEIDGNGDIEVELEPVTPFEGPAGIKVRCRKKNRYYIFINGVDTGELCPSERLGVEVGDHVVEIYDPVTDSRSQFPVSIEDTRKSLRVKVD